MEMKIRFETILCFGQKLETSLTMEYQFEFEYFIHFICFDNVKSEVIFTEYIPGKYKAKIINQWISNS